MNNFKPFGYLFMIVLPILLWIDDSFADSPKLSDNMIRMKTVKDKIFNGYDKMIRPTEEGSNATLVISGHLPKQIIEVDEEKALLSMDSYLWLIWKDPRLVWNKTTEYDGYLQLSPDLLWTPDISVYNSHSLQVIPMQEVLLFVTSEGTIYWFPPIFSQTSCPELNERVYPNEVVTCIVTLGAWVHDGWEIDYDHSETVYMDLFENINPRWELVVSDVKVIRNLTYYEGYDEPYVSIECIYPLKRRMPPEIESTRAPCILVMLLTLSIFWLPPNSSERVSFAGILFLVLVILLVYVAASTKFPLGAVLAVSFLQSTMYIVVATLLLQLLVISNLCNITGPVRPPAIVMQFLTGSFGTYACLRSSKMDQMHQLKEDSPNIIESPTPRDDWLLFAAAMDRLFFICMSISMVAVHHL